MWIGSLIFEFVMDNVVYGFWCVVCGVDVVGVGYKDMVRVIDLYLFKNGGNLIFWVK